MLRRLLLSLALVAPVVALAVPDALVHQGRLLDSTGEPLQGTNSLDLTLYDAPAGGNVVWQRTQPVAFDEGFFSVALDGVGPDIATGEPLYLALSVNDGPELPGRVALGSVPYAVRAGIAGGISGGVVDASEIRVNGTTVIDGTGTVVFGTIDSDTLADLGCVFDQFAIYDGSDWTCADNVHDAVDIVSGTLDIGRLPVGTSSDEVAAGDHQHSPDDFIGDIDATTLEGHSAADFVSRDEAFLRGADLASGATLSGLALSSGRLVLDGGGYGAGLVDLVVDGSNSPYALPPGVHEFRNVEVKAGAVLTTTAWNGLDGGSIEIRATGDVTIAGKIDLAGKGYRGGLALSLNSLNQWIPLTQHGSPGESYTGYGFHKLPAVEPNGGGGGGGDADSCSYGAGGGGGGYATAGSNGGNISAGPCSYGLQVQGGTFAAFATPKAQGGGGGPTHGDAAISRLLRGSGGGGAGSDSDCKGQHGGSGGNGGGAVAIYAKKITVAGTIDVSGQNGHNAATRTNPCNYPGNNGGGGGGSGGSIKLVGAQVTVASSGVLATTGGAGGTPLGSSTAGGRGGDGRIRLEGASVTNNGTIAATNTSAALSSATNPSAAGDATRGTWTSPLISFSRDGRFQSVDVFADLDEGVTVAGQLCTGSSPTAVDDDANCRPIAPSGAVDAPDGEQHAKVRLKVVDRSEAKTFALYGIRTTFGD